MNDIIINVEKEMEKALSNLQEELKKIRTGRAHTSMLDSVRVNAYDNLTPLNQVALLTTPDAQQILVKPFDKNLINEIEVGIVKADLGLNPINDGENIRVNVPALTEERRKDLVKDVKACGEQSKIRIRNIRHDFLNKVKKSDEYTQDDVKFMETQIQEKTNVFNKKIDDSIKTKEQEVLTI